MKEAAAALAKAQRKGESESRAREAIERQLSDVSDALEETTRARTVDAAAAAERLSRRETELSEALAETQAARERLELRFRAAEYALQQADERDAEDQASCTRRLSAKQNCRPGSNEKLRLAQRSRTSCAIPMPSSERRRNSSRHSDLVTRLTEQRANGNESTLTGAARDRLRNSCAKPPLPTSAPSTRQR